MATKVRVHHVLPVARSGCDSGCITALSHAIMLFQCTRSLGAAALRKYASSSLDFVVKKYVRTGDPRAPSSSKILSMLAYHAAADQTLEAILDAVDDLEQERDDVECELASGVLSIKCLDGSWVINKQAPNKQIWLSSPMRCVKRWLRSFQSAWPGSGPCMYECGEDGIWRHTRDASKLSDLLCAELQLHIHGI